MRGFTAFLSRGVLPTTTAPSWSWSGLRVSPFSQSAQTIPAGLGRRLSLIPWPCKTGDRLDKASWGLQPDLRRVEFNKPYDCFLQRPAFIFGQLQQSLMNIGLEINRDVLVSLNPVKLVPSWVIFHYLYSTCIHLTKLVNHIILSQYPYEPATGTPFPPPLRLTPWPD